MRVWSLVLLAVSFNAFAMETTDHVSVTREDNLPLSFHTGVGFGMSNNQLTPAFDLELGVGITEHFSLRGRANLLLIPTRYLSGNVSVEGDPLFGYGIVPTWSVHKRLVSVSMGPYLGAMSNNFVAGLAGSFVLHFGSGVGFTISPTYLTLLKGGGSIVTVTGGIGIEI